MILALNNEPDHHGPTTFADKTFTYRYFLDANPVFQQYGVRGFPTTFVIDRTGKIVNRHMGFGPGEEKTFEEEVQQLLSAQSASK